MVVKDNHKTIHRKLKVFFDGPCLFDIEVACHQSNNSKYRRLETRQFSSSDDLPARYTGFIDVPPVFRVRRQGIKKSTSEIREETVYGMTSLPQAQAGPKQLLSLLRQHWHI